MGVGLGYCIAAAVAAPERLVVAVEGDSAFEILFKIAKFHVLLVDLHEHTVSTLFCAILLFAVALLLFKLTKSDSS
jgi:hypothetical protein